MAKITLRPTSASGNSWSNMNNAYDGNQSTSASVSVSRFNYSSKTLTLNFNTSVIPSGATINSATLTMRSKAGKNTITAYVDINGDEGSRVINKQQSATATNYTANVASYISGLSNVVVTAHNTNWSGNTFELYELWIDVDYTASTTYTVRFLDWDNSVISTQTVTRGGSATPPPNPSRDGYTFTGWLGNYTNVTANVDIIAQYTKNSSGGEVDTSVKNIKLGASTIDKLYLGTSQILKAYLGSILLYSYSTGGTGGGDTPVIGDNYQLYTGYPLIVKNSSLDANYGSYITEIVGNTTQSSTDLTDIRSVGVLQEDGTYKVDIIASNQNVTQTQTKSIYLPQPLRMTRQYSDRLYWDDTLGKYCIEQNVAIFKMSEYPNSISNQSDTAELLAGYIGKYSNIQTTDCGFCNILPSYEIDWSFPNEGIYYGGGAVMYIVVSKDKASNMTELKQWCINNNFTCHVRYDTPVIVETDITDKILFNTYANYTKVITDEKEVAPISMSGNFASSNLWDGVSYLPGRVDDDPTWGDYTGQYTDNWSLIDPYGIQFDITASTMRGFTLQFENLTSGKYLNFTGKSNQPRYNFPEINYYFFDSSKNYLSKARTGISSDGVNKEIILTNGEMSASVLIPDNATCCEMTFKLSINESIVPHPQHIEITNINVIETDGGLA